MLKIWGPETQIGLKKLQITEIKNLTRILLEPHEQSWIISKIVTELRQKNHFQVFPDIRRVALTYSHSHIVCCYRPSAYVASLAKDLWCDCICRSAFVSRSLSRFQILVIDVSVPCRREVCTETNIVRERRLVMYVIWSLDWMQRSLLGGSIVDLSNIVIWQMTLPQVCVFYSMRISNWIMTQGVVQTRQASCLHVNHHSNDRVERYATGTKFTGSTLGSAYLNL